MLHIEMMKNAYKSSVGKTVWKVVLGKNCIDDRTMLKHL
jgi:hypothetical protein